MFTYLSIAIHFCRAWLPTTKKPAAKVQAAPSIRTTRWADTARAMSRSAASTAWQDRYLKRMGKLNLS